MANDAWDLQGLNGGVAIAPGQTFTGMSRGLQVVNDASFDYDLVNPAGAPVTLSVTAALTGVYLGGPVSAITVSSGLVVAFPTAKAYTVV